MQYLNSYLVYISKVIASLSLCLLLVYLLLNIYNVAWILMPDTFCKLKRVMNAHTTHNTDVDMWYHGNRNIQLLLHLLVSSSGLGASLRCLTTVDNNFHESCTPDILVTLLILSDLNIS